MRQGVSILNGIAGDLLARRGLPGSIAMTFVQEGRPLALNARSIETAQPQLTGKIVVLVHGWCCSEDVWNFADGATYATLLQQDAGYTPFAVRYNTGLPIADSGRDLARLMRALARAHPAGVDEIVLIGHSMGGLVIRAACDAPASADIDWTKKVRHAFYLGMPRAAADPGLSSAQHWQLVGTLTDDPRHPMAKVFGDGLVRVPQSAAPGSGPGDTRAGPHVIVLPGVHHLQLAHDPAAYEVIHRVCAAAPALASDAVPPA